MIVKYGGNAMKSPELRRAVAGEIAALRAEPVDSYGVGTSVVTGSGAPTASMVYKLVEVDGLPVAKRSSHKGSHGGRKQALRLAKSSGTIVEEVVYPFGGSVPDAGGFEARPLTVDLVRAGRPVAAPDLEDARRRVARGLGTLPWDGLKLSRGEPAVPTRLVG